MKKRTILLLPTLAIAWASGLNSAHAACEFNDGTRTGNVTFSLPALTESLNPSDTTRQRLSTVTISTAELASAMGTTPTQALWEGCTGDLIWNPLQTPLAGNSPDGTGFISTGIDNLYYYLYAGSRTTGNFGPFSTPRKTGIAWSRDLSTIHSAIPPWSVLGDMVLVLYQNGPIRQGGIIPAMPVAELKLSEGLQVMNMSTTALTINVLSCSITTPVVKVQMPTMFKTSFSGIGSASEATDFSIGANCDSGIMPTMTFSGLTSSAGNDVFAVNTGKGEVTGLGVQLLHGGKKINQNEAVQMATVPAAGPVDFPFTARYVQTEKDITSGEVNTTITFTLAYK